MNYNTPKGNWKEIESNEHYLVSDDGRVFSKRSNRTLKQSTKEEGYKVVGLWENNKGRMNYVHRLVLIHFGSGVIKDTVNHKDGNKDNNHISNLEWMTYAENNTHARDTGLNTTKHKRNKKGSIPVEKRCLEGKLIKVYPSMRQAERESGVDATSIGRGIRNGWKYGGFFWKFHDKDNEVTQ